MKDYDSCSPWWLPGGHLQTMYPAKLIRTPKPTYRRERWDTPDGDFIDVDFIDGTPGKPFVVMFHGLEGSSNSHYARAMMSHIESLGWSGAAPNFRGCSGELNHAPRFYHSGDSIEVDWIMRRIAMLERARSASRLYVCGVSLGANALLRWLGESGSKAGFVDAACAISAPLDLAGSGTALMHGINKVYTWIFLQTLKPKCLKKLEQFPGLFNRDRMMKANNLYDFDNAVTAPVHGYRDTDDYWNRASACRVLDDITVPTLVMNARNDPFLPAKFLPYSSRGNIIIEQPKYGGHAGFATAPFPGQTGWLPRRMVAFMESATVLEQPVQEAVAAL
ncbi:MAG: alpha/beta fold hydrolase [Paucimonas sp.]|jgi:predicted alpha/beta-fold hydrolase|nr:alpha/beta fold hydrolase [Paucimonas sp.]